MSLPKAADWSRCDFDVMKLGSAAADWSRNYVACLGCFNLNDHMLRISVPVYEHSIFNLGDALFVGYHN